MDCTIPRRRRYPSWYTIVLLSTTTLLLATPISQAFQSSKLTILPSRRINEVRNIEFNNNQIWFIRALPNNDLNEDTSLNRGDKLKATISNDINEPGRRSSRFGVRKRTKKIAKKLYKKSISALQSSPRDDLSNGVTKVKESGWSGSAEKGNGSRFGVRKRVRAVLEKAKSRTGVRNYSSEETGVAEVVASAASMGGLAEEADFVFKERVVLDQIEPKLNGSGRKQPSTNSPRQLPEENLVALETEDKKEVTTIEKKDKSMDGRKSVPLEVAGIKADVPTVLPEPLPFELPKLSNAQKQLLLAGERIQEQSRMGREGSGYVVVDVKAPPFVIWESLLDFEEYPNMIKTVRDMDLYTSRKLNAPYYSEKALPPGTGHELRHYGIPSLTRAAFILSKFKLNIAAIHTYTPHPDGHYMTFTLDPACKNVIFQNAKGIWYTEANPDGREDYTRVWLLCELRCSKILPTFIVDYAAKKAMPRATTWLKPHMEDQARIILGKGVKFNGQPRSK